MSADGLAAKMCASESSAGLEFIRSAAEIAARDFWLIGHRPLLNENLAPVQFLLIILANLGRTVIDLIS
jgi:hypothetical protein